MKNAVKSLEIENSAQFVLKGPSQLFAGSVGRQRPYRNMGSRDRMTTVSRFFQGRVQIATRRVPERGERAILCRRGTCRTWPKLSAASRRRRRHAAVKSHGKYYMYALAAAARIVNPIPERHYIVQCGSLPPRPFSLSDPLDRRTALSVSAESDVL